jgi:hypothetical protein
MQNQLFTRHHRHATSSILRQSPTRAVAKPARGITLYGTATASPNSAGWIYDKTWSVTAGRVSVGVTVELAYLPFSSRRPVILAMAEFPHRPAIHSLDQI